MIGSGNDDLMDGRRGYGVFHENSWSTYTQTVGLRQEPCNNYKLFTNWSYLKIGLANVLEGQLE